MKNKHDGMGGDEEEEDGRMSLYAAMQRPRAIVGEEDDWRWKTG